MDTIIENKEYAMKYDGMKKRECEIHAGNKYVEISYAGSPHAFILEYTEEGFKEQLINALRKRKFDILE